MGGVDVTTCTDQLDKHGRAIAFRPILVKITGSLASGLLLSQLLYWSKAMRGREFYKTNKSLMNETALTVNEIKGAKSRLIKKGFITTKLRRHPATTHYEINGEAIMEAVSSWLESSQLNGRNPANKMIGIQPTIHTENKSENKKENTTPLIPPRGEVEGWFDEIWNSYPTRVGRKKALRHFKATVKTDTHLQEIRTSLENYKNQVEWERTRKDGFHRQYQNGGTWFNNWQDWLDYKVEKISTPNAMKLAKPPQLSRDELQFQIQRQMAFVKGELAEGVDRDFVWFHWALGCYVVDFEARFRDDPMTSRDRAWFDHKREEFLELDSADYAVSREEEATEGVRL